MNFLYTDPTHLHGDNKLNILHSRFRMGFTQLNADLYTRTLSDTPLCECGHMETYTHFFLECQQYVGARNALLNGVNPHIDTQHMSKRQLLELLLKGSNNLTSEQNCNIFRHVQEYIQASKRFST